MKTLGGVAALACAVLLAGCSSDSGTSSQAPSPTISLSPYTLPSNAVTAVPTTETPTPTPAATTYKLSKKKQNKFIRVLYAQYTDEWVVEKPDAWIDLGKTICGAYVRVGPDARSQVLESLNEQLSDGASRWLLATSLTLICPDVDS